MLVKQKRQDGGSAGWAFKDKRGHATARRQLFYLLMNKVRCRPPPLILPESSRSAHFNTERRHTSKDGETSLTKRRPEESIWKTEQFQYWQTIIFLIPRNYGENKNDTEETYTG